MGPRPSAVEAALEAVAPRGEKVAGPAVEADAVDEVGRALGRLQIVFAAGIVGIADAAVTIAVVDAVLAPDLSLAHVDSLIGGKQPLVLGIHEAGHQRTAGDSRRPPSGIMQRLWMVARICSRVSYMGAK